VAGSDCSWKDRKGGMGCPVHRLSVLCSITSARCRMLPAAVTGCMQGTRINRQRSVCVCRLFLRLQVISAANMVVSGNDEELDGG